MKKVFLDTNILLDAALGRQYSKEALTILQSGEDNNVELYATTLTYANIAYILRKHSKDEIYNYLRALRTGINILSIDESCLDAAIEGEAADFEDMLQYQCALKGGCDYIITNNNKDFIAFSNLPVFSSSEFLEQMGATKMR